MNICAWHSGYVMYCNVPSPAQCGIDEKVYMYKVIKFNKGCRGEVTGEGGVCVSRWNTSTGSHTGNMLGELSLSL